MTFLCIAQCVLVILFLSKVQSTVVSRIEPVDNVPFPKDGSLSIVSLDMYNSLAHSDIGVNSVREVKFIVINVHESNSKAYFINSETFPLHAAFATKYFDEIEEREDFDQNTYFRDERVMTAGSFIFYDSYEGVPGHKGVFVFSFWPTDKPTADHIIRTARAIEKAAAPLLNMYNSAYQGRVVWHLTTDSQENLYFDNIERFKEENIPILTNNQLLGALTYVSMNPGEAYGVLRILRSMQVARQPTVKDVVVYAFAPNELTHVAGIITQQPQTPLSHVNLKARQNKTPNSYIRNATNLAELVALENRPVYYSVNGSAYVVRAAHQAELDAWLQKIRPSMPIVPEYDLSVRDATPLSEIRHENWTTFGVKAANVAELHRLLKDERAPNGYALPFAMYDEFMSLERADDGRRLMGDPSAPLTGERNSLYAQARRLLQDERVRVDADYRAAVLNELRSRIVAAQLSASLVSRIEVARAFFAAGAPIRCRSSTNNEDLEGFNGAGLYASFTHNVDEGVLANTARQVWSSLWTQRAYDERDFYRIDHFRTYMGVLIHAAYGDEQANGVVVTRNIYLPAWRGMYVNAQYGEISITNPEPLPIANARLPSHLTEWPSDVTEVAAVPDEMLFSEIAAQVDGRIGYAWETQFLRRSNVKVIYGEQPVPSETVLLDYEQTELRRLSERIHSRFRAIYNAYDDECFAMDLEFKVTYTEAYNASSGEQPRRGYVAVKQARPWVSGEGECTDALARYNPDEGEKNQFSAIAYYGSAGVAGVGLLVAVIVAAIYYGLRARKLEAHRRQPIGLVADLAELGGEVGASVLGDGEVKRRAPSASRVRTKSKSSEKLSSIESKEGRARKRSKKKSKRSARVQVESIQSPVTSQINE